MTGKTHQSLGLFCGLLSYLTQPATYNPATLAAVVAVSSLGALLPDIDSPAGKIWSYLPFNTGHLGSEMVSPFLKHRNITHSLLGFIIVLVLLREAIQHIPFYWGINGHALLIAAGVGYASHLLADAVTVEGIPFLFPYPKMFGIPPHPLQGLRIETGQWFENLIIYPLVNLALIGLIWTHFAELKVLLLH